MAQRGITEDTSILSMQESFFRDFLLPGFTILSPLATDDSSSVEKT
jgi:hypothetical protein